MIRCPLTGNNNTKIIYEQKAVPLVQNKVYPNKLMAKNAQTIDVILGQSLDNGFVFSAKFNDSIINYDEHYQNEQSNSLFFQDHLNHMIGILNNNNLLGKKIIKIGCGKGYFMNMLLDKGEDIIGFDPTYEGKSIKL